MAKFNFRETAGYVTDGAGETYVLNDVYPTVRDTLTFGYDSTTGISTRDRVDTNDPEFAGEHFIDNNAAYSRTFIYNSGNGTFDVSLASGALLAQSRQFIEIVALDSSNVEQSVLAVVGTGPVDNPNFMDAGGNLRTSIADWQSNAASVQVELTGASVRIGIKIGAGDGSTAYTTHLNTIEITTAVVASLSIDSTDATMAKQSTFGMTVSNPPVTPTSANTSLTLGVIQIPLSQATNTSGDIWDLEFPIGDIPRQADATGYAWTLDVGTAVVANTAPVVSLVGNASIPLTVGDTYTEQGATVADSEDGVLTIGDPIFNPPLDLTTAGTYVATYSVTDSGGLVGTATRDVVVSAASGGGVSEGAVTTNSFFDWDVESAPIGPLNSSTTGVPFDELDIYAQGPCHISTGPAGVGPRSGTRCIRMDMDADEDGAFFLYRA